MFQNICIDFSDSRFKQLKHFTKRKLLDQVSTDSTLHCCVNDNKNKNIHVYLEKLMFWKVLSLVFVPSSGLDENKIKGASSQLYPIQYILA